MPREAKVVSLQDAEVRFSNGTRLEMSGFGGVATQWAWGGSGLRSAMLPAERDVAPGFTKALAEVEIEEQETIHFDARAATARVRSADPRRAAAERVVLRPAPPGREAVQVVWYQDESGGVTWHLPDGFLANGKSGAPKTVYRSGLRAGPGASFTIPTRTAAAQRSFATEPVGGRLRGPIVKLGRKIFKVLLVVPLSKLAAGPVASIVGSIERRYRQELVRGVTLENYRRLVQTPFADWGALDGKRSLLIVHGIFSTSHGMLAGLPPAAMEGLLAHYGGRVIALDQLTVTNSPEQNAAAFLKKASEAHPKAGFSFDVLCHSRGGIVSRTLAERGEALVPGHPCAFPKVFFVAAPNAGSPLGDAAHMLDMIDVFTNLITNFPDGPVIYSFEVLLALVKLLAYSAETNLPGIRDMSAAGYIAGTLNAAAKPSPSDYAAAASNYEPRAQDNAFFNGRLANSVIDRVFEQAANDLVVPRDGVFAKNGHPSFPIAKTLVYGKDDHVWHTDYFTRQPTLDAIFRHFGIAVPGEAATAASVTETAGEAAVVREEDDLLETEEDRVDVLLGGPRSGREWGYRVRGGVREPRDRKSARETRTAPGPAAESSSAVAVQRQPEIAFHEQVVEGVSNELVVRLADLAGAAGGPMLAVPFAPNEEIVELTVRLYAPGFEVEPDEVATMTVHRGGDSKTEAVRFQLTARNPGMQPLRREITAEFWLRNAPLGSVTHWTIVVPKGWTGPAPGDGGSKARPFAIPLQRREDCDLILMIEGQSAPGQAPFRLRLRSEIPGSAYASLDCGLLDLPQKDLSSYVNSALDEVIGQYPSSGAMSEAAFAQAAETWRTSFLKRLGDLGRQLWKFLPQRFRDEYFRFYEQDTPPRSIGIYSDEMIFPWELVIPNEKRGGRFVELPCLGITHVLGRWKTALPIKPTPQRLRVDSFVVVNPAYPPPDDLPWSVSETAALRRLFPKVEIFKPPTEAGIRADLLQRNDVRLLHFSGHGAFQNQNADLSQLLLEDGGSLTAMAIANTKLGAEASPIVYLNACSVGTQGITVGRAGGFAADCLDGGFSGVVAPYWPVNDARAAKFSIELYRRLLSGRAVGEALRDLRDENRDDPTFLAFAYFGDPWARVSFELG
jgi:hypothetical protein